MNRDGCRNCKFMIKTGLAQIMRCSKDDDMVGSLDKCSNYRLVDKSVTDDKK